jgi:hypothetical protein
VRGTAAALQLGHRKSVDIDFFRCRYASTSLMKIVKESMIQVAKSYPAIVEGNRKIRVTIYRTKIKIDHHLKLLIESLCRKISKE